MVDDNVYYKDEFGVGQALFDSIDFRYISAIAGTIDQEKEPPEFTQDLQVWETYRGILADIREDIRWLRTNPLYGKIQKSTLNFVFM